MADNCCHYCKPPKRYPGCHDHCNEFLEQKAQREKDAASQRQKIAIQNGITSQKYDGVFRAYRRKGRK